MSRLIIRAKEIGKGGEVPVSALILNSKGHCIGYGSNRRNQHHDPLGHAELVALRQAAWIKNDWRFNDCTLIVTLEPCPMCAGALVQARMGQVIYGASDIKRGALGSTMNLGTHHSSHHKIIIRRGVLKEQASKLLKDWFIKRRNSNL